ncbi:MAG: hypothetical protein ACUVTW_15065, partial [Thermogutta sp.]
MEAAFGYASGRRIDIDAVGRSLRVYAKPSAFARDRRPPEEARGILPSAIPSPRITPERVRIFVALHDVR